MGMDIDFDAIFKQVEEQNLAHGIFFLTYLIGSRYVFKGVPKSIKSLFEMFIVRVFVIFSAAFVATKNTRNALILASAYIVIFELTFNPKSALCLIGCQPEKKKNQVDIGANNQTVIQQQQPGPQQQQIQTQLQPNHQLPPLQMDMSPPMNPGPMAFGVENFSNY